MSVSLPVIVGAGVVIVALLCIGVTARRRRLRADAATSTTEAVEAVFVDDMPGELASFVPAVEPHSEPAAAHAHVYPVHKLQQADAPITFGPSRREGETQPPVAEPAQPQIEMLVEAVPEPIVPKLEVVPDREPEREVEPEVATEPAVVASEPDVASEPEVAVSSEVQAAPVAPAIAREPVIELPVEQEPTVEAAPVTEPVPTPEVAMLSAQIEVLAATIARLTDRLDAVAAVAAVAPAPVTEPSAFVAAAEAAQLEPEPEPALEPELEPEPVVLRSVAYEPEAEFALETELETDIERDVEPEFLSVIEPEPRIESSRPDPSRPKPVARADRMVRPPAVPRDPAAEPTTYARKRVDDDLLMWPSDEDLERFSGRQGRRDI